MELQIEQNLRFQRRDWAAQRVAITLMAVFVLVGAAGLLGPGPLSHARADAVDDAIRVDYLRWARRGRDANLTLHVQPAHLRGPELPVEMPAAYFADMQLRAITPEPLRVETLGDTLRFVFGVPGPDTPVQIEFDVQGQGMGPLEGEIRVHDAIVRFRQFLWP